MARLIDVEPLIDECDECINIEWNHKVAPVSWADAEEEFKQRLLDAPTIEAEPVKHGKWIEKYCSWYCSECGKSGYKGYIPAKPSDFCPNCGARMDGE